MLIGPDPIIGRRELEDARPVQKKNPQIGARRWNVSIATRKAIFSAFAPRRTKKERNQSKPRWLKQTPITPKKNSKKEVFWKNLLPEQKTFPRR